MKARQVLVSLAFLLTTTACANLAKRDYTDLWWTPEESGWGMQITQTDDVMFVTVYVYRTDATPTWFTALLLRATSLSDGVWSGELFASEGPWYGEPFDPRRVTRRKAGTMSFVPQEVGGTLLYTVDAVTVSKRVERLAVRNVDLTGTYIVSMTFAYTSREPFFRCRHGEQTYGGLLEVMHHAGQIEFKLVQDVGAKHCWYKGSYEHEGKHGRFSGTYTCRRRRRNDAVLRDHEASFGAFGAV